MRSVHDLTKHDLHCWSCWSSSFPTGTTDNVVVTHILPYLVGVSVVILLLILVLGMLAAKRKHKHGVLWLPDGFMANKNDKRREPVGQDDFDLK